MSYKKAFDDKTCSFPIHEKPSANFSFDRLNMLWERYPGYHSMSTFATLEELLKEHESYQEDFAELREEYVANHYDRFLVQLSWADLPYRFATKELIETSGQIKENSFEAPLSCRI